MYACLCGRSLRWPSHVQSFAKLPVSLPPDRSRGSEDGRQLREPQIAKPWAKGYMHAAEATAVHVQERGLGDASGGKAKSAVGRGSVWIINNAKLVLN